MKRTIASGKLRVSGRRRRPVRLILELLEDRVVLAAPPVAAAAPQVTVPVVQPPTLVPDNTGVPPAPVGQVAPPHDAVFFNPLLQLGGGHPPELLHFPASGGGHQDKPLPPQTSNEMPASEQQIEGEVFAGDLWSEGHQLIQNEETVLALTKAVLVDVAA